MVEREKFDEYMLYGIKEKITLKKCIENEILILLFSLPSFFIGAGGILSWVLGALPFILYFIFIVKFQKARTIEGTFYILHNGVFAGCFSFIFALTGIEILLYLFQGKARNVVICIASIGYIVIILLYSYLIKKIIERKDCNGTKKVKGRIFFTLFGVLGITVARTFFDGMDTRKAMELLCVLCFFLSYVTLIGIFNIFKFLYLVKYIENVKEE